MDRTIVNYFDRLKDGLFLLKKSFLLPNDKIDLDSMRQVVNDAWKSFDGAFKKNDLSNSNKTEDEKFYLDFIQERRSAGHSIMMFVTCKDQDLVVGMMDPFEIAVCIDRLMKQPEIANAIMAIKLRQLGGLSKGSNIIEMPSDMKSSDVLEALQDIIIDTKDIDPSSEDGPEHISSIIRRTIKDLNNKRAKKSSEPINVRNIEDIGGENKT